MHRNVSFLDFQRSALHPGGGRKTLLPESRITHIHRESGIEKISRILLLWTSLRSSCKHAKIASCAGNLMFGTTVLVGCMARAAFAPPEVCSILLPRFGQVMRPFVHRARQAVTST